MQRNGIARRTLNLTGRKFGGVGDGAAMKSEPTGNGTSAASPGQAEKRDQLIRIYDELDDAGKQELLRLAEELSKPH